MIFYDFQTACIKEQRQAVQRAYGLWTQQQRHAEHIREPGRSEYLERCQVEYIAAESESCARYKQRIEAWR